MLHLRYAFMYAKILGNDYTVGVGAGKGGDDRNRTGEGRDDCCNRDNGNSELGKNERFYVRLYFWYAFG